MKEKNEGYYYRGRACLDIFFPFPSVFALTIQSEKQISLVLSAAKVLLPLICFKPL